MLSQETKRYVMNKLLLCMLTWGMMITPVQAYYRVDCNGYDSNGTCSFGGSLDAYNSETNDWVYGDCEGE